MIESLANIKVFLGIDPGDTTQDALLNMLNADAQGICESYCRRRFEQDTYTEFYSGTGTHFIVLKQRPVQSLTNVWLDNNGFWGEGVGPSSPFGSTTLLTIGIDYALATDETLSDGSVVSRAGLLSRIGTIWPELNAYYFPGRLTQEYGPAYGNIKVTYVAGYSAATMPNDLKRAIRTLVSQARQEAPYGRALESESISDYTYSMADMDLDARVPGIGTVKQILNRYREIAVGDTTMTSPGSYGRG